MDDAGRRDAIVLANVRTGCFGRSMGGGRWPRQGLRPPLPPSLLLRPIPSVPCGLAPPAVTRGRGAPALQMPKAIASLPAACPAPESGAQHAGTLPSPEWSAGQASRSFTYTERRWTGPRWWRRRPARGWRAGG